MTNVNSEPPVDVDAFLAHYGVKGMRWGVRRDNYGSNKGGGTLRTSFRPTYTNEERQQARANSKVAKKRGYSATDSEGFDQARVGKLRTPARRAVNIALGTKVSIPLEASAVLTGYATTGLMTAGAISTPVGFGLLVGAAAVSAAGQAHQAYTGFFQNMKNNPRVRVKTKLTAKELAAYQLGKNFQKELVSKRGTTKFSVMNNVEKLEFFDREGRRVGGLTSKRNTPSQSKIRSLRDAVGKTPVSKTPVSNR